MRAKAQKKKFQKSKTYRPDQLVHASETFFGLNAALHFPFVALLVPDLEPLVKLAHEVSANLVIYHAQQATSAIFRRVPNVDARLASLRVMRHTSWSHLCYFELD